MIVLDSTIVNVAFTDMIDKLDASLDEILWVTNAYSLAYAVLLITAGRVGDLVGARWLYIGGLLHFTAASAACGLAHDPKQLIAGRVAQVRIPIDSLSGSLECFGPAKKSLVSAQARGRRAGVEWRPDTAYNCAPSGRLSIAVDALV